MLKDLRKRREMGYVAFLGVDGIGLDWIGLGEKQELETGTT